jgi:hypothetical protein
VRQSLGLSSGARRSSIYSASGFWGNDSDDDDESLIIQRIADASFSSALTEGVRRATAAAGSRVIDVLHTGDTVSAAHPVEGETSFLVDTLTKAAAHAGQRVLITAAAGTSMLVQPVQECCQRRCLACKPVGWAQGKRANLLQARDEASMTARVAAASGGAAARTEPRLALGSANRLSPGLCSAVEAFLSECDASGMCHGSAQRVLKGIISLKALYAPRVGVSEGEVRPLPPCRPSHVFARADSPTHLRRSSPRTCCSAPTRGEPRRAWRRWVRMMLPPAAHGGGAACAEARTDPRSSSGCALHMPRRARASTRARTRCCGSC